jgi:FKBP-type peptidyl-prolyl cis-trans isomerase (trigger factor)
MKTEFTGVSETRKHLSFEIEPDVVAAEIDRVAKACPRSARVPGFAAAQASCVSVTRTRSFKTSPTI